MLFKRVPRGKLSEVFSHQDLISGTPLYAVSTTNASSFQQERIQFLLDAGANLETEGGEHGTALMGACAAGRFEAVKILVQKGAKMVYSKDGRVYSSLRAANHFPEIIRWLLVGRHSDGHRLLTW